jgi:hypothetical protein
MDFYKHLRFPETICFCALSPSELPEEGTTGVMRTCFPPKLNRIRSDGSVDVSANFLSFVKFRWCYRLNQLIQSGHCKNSILMRMVYLTLFLGIIIY